MKTAGLSFFYAGLLLLCSVPGWSQSTPAQAFDNVIIHIADGKTIKGGTVVWRSGVIESAGRKGSIPFDAYVIDGGDSLHVYPGFIDGLALWGSPALPKEYKNPERPGEPGYKRAGIQPQREPNKLLKAKDKDLEAAQKRGFTTAALGLKGHMLPGQIDLFFINGEDTGDYLLQEGIGLSASFEEAPGGFGSGAYPATLMGTMARYRQLWYDATALMEQEEYYASASSNYSAPKKDEVLEALFSVMQKEQPLFFVVDAKENIERLFWLKDELGFNVVLVSGKEAYKQAGELKKRDIPVLASIDLPDEPKWKAVEKKSEEEREEKKESEEAMEEVSEEMRIFRERQLEAYKASIDNIKKLMEAGVNVGYASNGMKLSDLDKHLKTLKEESKLTDAQILQMLTRNTADILGIGNKMGDVKKGRIANFTVFSKPFREEKTKALYSVSGGNLTEFESKSSNDKKGKEE